MPCGRHSRAVIRSTSRCGSVGLAAIAREWLFARAIRPAIAASAKDWFRVVEFNVLSNHVHLIVEADGADALSRGVQGLAIRIARRVNSALKRRGKLFGQRFHARTMKTPRDVRNTLRYVLLNRKHHAATQRFYAGWLDPYSSAIGSRLERADSNECRLQPPALDGRITDVRAAHVAAPRRMATRRHAVV